MGSLFRIAAGARVSGIWEDAHAMNLQRAVATPLIVSMWLLILPAANFAAVDAATAGVAPRVIDVDMNAVEGPLDRFFSACVGSDRAIIHLRPEDLRDLKRVHDECGFRYLR